jgi:hypothetical protein
MKFLFCTKIIKLHLVLKDSKILHQVLLKLFKGNENINTRKFLTQLIKCDHSNFIPACETACLGMELQTQVIRINPGANPTTVAVVKNNSRTSGSLARFHAKNFFQDVKEKTETPVYG